MIVLGDAFEIVLFHFGIGELKAEVDVEGSNEYFFLEVVFVVEGHGFFMIEEFNFDDSILGVD